MASAMPGGTAPSPGPAADTGGHVVVQAVEIQGLGDQLHVFAGRAEGRRKEGGGPDDVRVLAEQHGIRVEPVLRHVHESGADLVQRVRGGRDQQ